MAFKKKWLKAVWIIMAAVMAWTGFLTPVHGGEILNEQGSMPDYPYHYVMNGRTITTWQRTGPYKFLIGNEPAYCVQLGVDTTIGAAYTRSDSTEVHWQDAEKGRRIAAYAWYGLQGGDLERAAAQYLIWSETNHDIEVRILKNESSVRKAMQEIKEKAGRDDADFTGYIYTCTYRNAPLQEIMSAVRRQERKVRVSVEKVSCLPAVTEENSLYSLGGAQYGVYGTRMDAERDQNRICVIETDESGRGTSEEFPQPEGKTAFVRELKASTGYQMDPAVYSAYFNQTVSCIRSCEMPRYSTLSLQLEKKSADIHDNGIPAPMENAVFTVSYYRGRYQDVHSLPPQPARQWKIASKKENGHYMAHLNKSSLLAGSDELFYDNAGNPVLPLGTITIQETEAPAGYLLQGAEVNGQPVGMNEGMMLVPIEENNSVQSGGSLQCKNVITVLEQPVRAGFSLHKEAVDSRDSLQGDMVNLKTSFHIRNCSEYDAVLKADGRVLAQAEGNGIFQNEDGYEYIMETDEKGRWTSSSDFLPYGKYLVEETEIPEGTRRQGKISFEVQVHEDGSVTVDEQKKEEGTFCNDMIRGGLRIRKNDAFLHAAMPEGDSDLSALFALYNRSSHSVWVDTDKDGSREEFHPGDIIADASAQKKGQTAWSFATDQNGWFESEDSWLPYGSYEVREISAPRNYRLNKKNSCTFQIRSNGEMVSLMNEIENEPALGKARIYKHFNKQDGSEWDDRPEENAVFLTVLTSKLNAVYGGSMTDAYRHLKNRNGMNVQEGDHFLSAHEFSIVTTDKDGWGETGKLAAGNYTICQMEGNPDYFIIDEKSSFDILAEQTVNADGYPSYEDQKDPVLRQACNDQKTYQLIILKRDQETGRIVSLNGASFRLIADHPEKDTDGDGIADEGDGELNEADYSYTSDASCPLARLNELAVMKGYVTMRIDGQNFDTFRTCASNNQKIPAGTYAVSRLNGQKIEPGSAMLPLRLNKGTYFIEECDVPAGYMAGEPVKFHVDGSCYADVPVSSVSDVQKDIFERMYAWAEYLPEWLQGLQNMKKDDVYFTTRTVRNRRILGELEFEKKILQKEADCSLINGEKVASIAFSLTAAEDVHDPADGTVIVRKGEEARLLKDGHYIPAGMIYPDEKGRALIKDIPLGRYILKEVSTPAGIVRNCGEYPVVFDEKQSRNGICQISLTGKKALINEPTETRFSKKAVTGEKELPGAGLRILNDRRKVVRKPDGSELSWISGEREYVIEGLAPGTYYLEETTAPEKTVRHTSSVRFEVRNTSEIQRVEMRDKTVSFHKENLAGERLEGAEITVYACDEEGKIQLDADGSGKIIEVFETRADEDTYLSGLETGKQYLIRETEAPGGYLKAADILFRVDEKEEDQVIIMQDERPKVLIQKEDENGRIVKGAHLVILEAEKGSDGHVVPLRDEKGSEKIIHEFVSGETAEDVSGMLEHSGNGEEHWYILRETEAPSGFEKMSDQTFTAEGSESKPQVIRAVNQRKKLQIRIHKTNGKGHPLSGAEFGLYDLSDRPAADVHDRKCLGTTDAEGNLTFEVEFNGDFSGYYVKEIKAPEGYRLNQNRFEVSQDSDITAEPIVINIENLPQQVSTGDTAFRLKYTLLLAAALGSAAVLVKIKKKLC